MRFATTILVSIFICGATACSSFAPSREKIDEAEFGRMMSEPEIKQLADDWLVSNLKDPGSRIVNWGQFGKMWVWTGLLGDGHVYGYGSVAGVNARNGFGGYTGSQVYIFLAKDGKLVFAQKANAAMETHGFISDIE